jgi:hypothetical protein
VRGAAMQAVCATLSMQIGGGGGGWDMLGGIYLWNRLSVLFSVRGEGSVMMGACGTRCGAGLWMPG